MSQVEFNPEQRNNGQWTFTSFDGDKYLGEFKDGNF
jgi:hypothetical protein